VFADHLYAVFGMQYLRGSLFVLHNPKFSRFRDEDGMGRDREELIEQTNPEPWALDWNDHVPSNFRLAMDGYFYVAVGDKGLYGAVDRSGRRVDLHGGGVVRIRPDGTGLEVFARGVRNILDVAMDAEDELFTYDNTDENQWMGRVTHMVDGGFYGYPFDFIPRRPYTLWMFADYGPGAACGAVAYTDDALPAEYRGNLFLADFGQRNLRRVILAREAGTFRAVRDELLFPDPPPDFRPVGIHETEDGRGFYICDWQHLDNKQEVTVGRLWKLSAVFATNGVGVPDWYVAAAMGKPVQASVPSLLEALAHPRKMVRQTAQHLLSQQGPSVAGALLGLITNGPTRLALACALGPPRDRSEYPRRGEGASHPGGERGSRHGASSDAGTRRARRESSRAGARPPLERPGPVPAVLGGDGPWADRGSFLAARFAAGLAQGGCGALAAFRRLDGRPSHRARPPSGLGGSRARSGYPGPRRPRTNQLCLERYL
jgi:hypothetical protein